MIAFGALAMALIVSAVCGGPRSPMDVGEPAPFDDEGATQASGYDGREPKVEMEKRGDLWLVTVFQGLQPSGGYAIRIERAIHVGTGLRLRARFTTPAAGEAVPPGSTSPAHTISIRWGADGIELYDQGDRELLHWLRPHSDGSRVGLSARTFCASWSPYC